MNKVTNGRVDIKTPNTSTLFQMYDKIPANQCVTFRNATEGLWTSNSLSNAFFSEQNIQIIQNAIRAGVYNRSNGQYTIGPQDCDALKIIMRSIYLQHSANKPTDVTILLNSSRGILSTSINSLSIVLPSIAIGNVKSKPDTVDPSDVVSASLTNVPIASN